ncbi:MAG: hypothetical protein GAK37_02335 [Pseudomonas sp.]|nr:MAG: hypothetical protein GAK37_02335 [Pseudomonas sp.]
MIRQSLLVPFAAGTLLLALCGTASAEDNPALTKCLDGANTTAAMLACNVNETKVQDARLNKAYKAALDVQQGAKKQQLQDVQRLWIKYRDANCGFISTATGGTNDAVNGAACVLDMTETRAVELEGLLPL